MNRDRYRLVRHQATGQWVPVSEHVRGHGKGLGRATVLLALAACGLPAAAELPVPCTGGPCGTNPLANVPFVHSGQASYTTQGNNATVSQVGDKAILNWRSFNMSPGTRLTLQQVDNLNSLNPVAGASFTNLSRIWDANPSVLAGAITQAAGQKANFIPVNGNGIAFINGAQVNLNSLTASSLDIRDTFVLDQFLTSGTLTPQFEGTGGFVKVLEGARITADSQGRVMLIAPTVVNKGEVSAPDGQVILAAGTKVFLRSDTGNPYLRGLLVEVDTPEGLGDFDTANPDVRNGQLDGREVGLTDAARDKLGHATNLGRLTAARGNVTMVGFAVNQLGRASATTSVVANGSVFLKAKDRAVDAVNSTRGGRVTLGADSRTAVMPDLDEARVEAAVAAGTLGREEVEAYLDGSADATVMARMLPYIAATGSLDAQAQTPSRVEVLGRETRMAGGALVRAVGGEVEFTALDDPSRLNSIGQNPLTDPVTPVSETARIHIADGARIDVAGLEGVQVSVERNSTQVELRGDELKDSPVNREGPLRGKTVYVDIERAQTNAQAGVETLIAADSLAAYEAKQERTVAERSTAGGTVRLLSQGEVILATGAQVDLSGGSLTYTPGYMKTTLLSQGGTLVDIADAVADSRYDGISTVYEYTDTRWNVTRTINLGQSVRYDAGYVEGKNAGSLEVQGNRLVVQGDIQGRTTVGERQRQAAIQPLPARLRVGRDGSGDTVDFKLNQLVRLAAVTPRLDAGFAFGQSLPDALKQTLSLSTSLVGEDKVGRLEVFSNLPAQIADALRLPQGGTLQVKAKGVTVGADVTAPSGSINLAAVANSFDLSSLPLDLAVAGGVTLAARGAWVNELPGMGTAEGAPLAMIHGGSVSLTAGQDLILGDASVIDVTGGGRVSASGRLSRGNGGTISLQSGVGNTLQLGAELKGHGAGKGGKLTLTTREILIGAAVTAPGVLNLDPAFFRRGGFASYVLNGYEGVEVAADTVIAPRPESLELRPGFNAYASGARLEDFSDRVARTDDVRQAVNLSLTAGSSFLGDVTVAAGAVIDLDPAAELKLTAGHAIDVGGQLLAPGGSISLSLNRNLNDPYDPASAIWLRPGSELSVAGLAKVYADAKGLAKGTVLGGGALTLDARTGFLVAMEGALLDLSGAAPVWLDIPNEQGGLGKWVGSDAGSLSLSAREGMVLDATVKASPGAQANRGGRLSVAFGSKDSANGSGYPGGGRVLSLIEGLAPVTAGMTPGSAAAFQGLAALDTRAMEAAGFENFAFRGRDGIRLEPGLALGAGAQLREIRLDSPRISGAGGTAGLTAEVVRMGNFDVDAQGTPAAPTVGTGTLTVDARLLELAGDFTLDGLATADLKGRDEVRFSAVGGASGTLRTSADLLLTSAVTHVATLSEYTLDAVARLVEFAAAGSAVMPLSAGGALTVNARDIVQGGRLWLPLGSISLNADEAVTFGPGSLTRVSANADSRFLFGRTVNQRDWVYEIEGVESSLEALPEKSVRVSAGEILMDPTASIDLAGGGDLLAYEFNAGPGGSRDILEDSGVYAILPSYAGAFAPADPQSLQDFDRALGDAVYLSGGGGLKAGVYTLLPARYALLEGAYLVKLGNGRDMQPVQNTTRDDGTQLMAGYYTDSRGGPADARWSAFEVMSRAQVLRTSEFAMTSAADYFTGRLPADAGLLSLSAQTGLELGAIFRTGAIGGHGAQVDISAPHLAIVSGNPAGIDAHAIRLEAAALNAFEAESLLLGATRSTTGSVTTLTVEADRVTLANDGASALAASEIILAAQDTLTLKAGSAIVADGPAVSGTGLVTRGDGALVRAATGSAGFARSDVARSKGTLIAEGQTGAQAAASITAAAITLDATLASDFRGSTAFRREGKVVAGDLGLGGTRVSFGAAPAGTAGLVFDQAELDAMAGLGSLTLTSYSTFDFHGDVRVGGALDANGVFKPSFSNMTLQGAGLAGIGNAGKTAHLGVTGTLTLSNPGSAAFSAGGTPGDGTLKITADTLVLGQGGKAIRGFDGVGLAVNELVGQDTGTTEIAAARTDLGAARIRGETGSDQALLTTGILEVSHRQADRTLAEVTALGARWVLAGTEVGFDTLALLPSGRIGLTASAGDLRLGPAAGTDSHAEIDVSGRTVAFYDVSRPSPAGRVDLVSETGDIVLAGDTQVNVSAAPGGDAGELRLTAAQGRVELHPGSRLWGLAPADAGNQRGEGARLVMDVAKLADFSALNTRLNAGGFDGARILRVRDEAALTIAATDTVRAGEVRIGVDAGALTVAGLIDASGADAGEIALYARDNLTLADGARLHAYATGAGENGGMVEIESASGEADLSLGKANVSGGAGGTGGRIRVIAAQTGSVADYAAPLADTGSANAYKVPVPAGVTALVEGQVFIFTAANANSLASATLQVGTLPAKAIRKNGGDNLAAGDIGQNAVVAVMYDGANFQMVAADTGSGLKAKGFAADAMVGASQAALYGRKSYEASNLDAKLATRIKAESAVFADVANSLAAGGMSIRPAVEVRAPAGGNGDLTLSADWNLAYANRPDARAGLLTLRAPGNLKLNRSLSDGFNAATATVSGAPATLLPGDAWSYRLVAGADIGAADPLAVRAPAAGTTSDVTLANARLVRTGNGDIRIASGGSIRLGNYQSVIYTAGRPAEAIPGFTVPDNAQFSQGGGDVALTALGDIAMTADPSVAQSQLFTSWLHRQGEMTAEGSDAYALQPAWWVRFDQFQQGVGALGGGNVTLSAGGLISKVSAHAPTQGRMAASGADDPAGLVVTGGGDLRVEAAGDILGGQYYAGRGELILRTGGSLDYAYQIKTGQRFDALYTLIALGDARARVSALGDLNLHAIVNPHLVVQTDDCVTCNIENFLSHDWSVFSTYGSTASVRLSSLAGDVLLANATSVAPDGVARLESAFKATGIDWSGETEPYSTSLLKFIPPSLEITAYQGDVSVGGEAVMLPRQMAQLGLLAAGNVGIAGKLTMSDANAIPDAIRPADDYFADKALFDAATSTNGRFAHAVIPVHRGDGEPARIYALGGDISGSRNTLNLRLPKAFDIRAARDVNDLGIQAQHANASGDISRILAGRDILFTTGDERTDASRIYLGGPGQLEVSAGRDIDLGTSSGIVSRGDLDNPYLPAEGVSLYLAAGVGAANVDYTGSVDRLITTLEGMAGGVLTADETPLWQARWLTGEDGLADAAQALAAVRRVDDLDARGQRARVLDMLYTALRVTGRDHNDPASPYAGDYSRGYRTLELAFPGIEARDEAGGFAHYAGSINLFASRIKTERGGDIEFLVPGGQMIVGLTNTRPELVNVGSNVLGIVTSEAGDIRGFTREDILVNQSRILTVGGGDILLWSSEADIDAGKGKKTAVAVPPPIIKVDAQGNVTQELQGAATGSGIGALTGKPGVVAGDVDLIAPKGAVNAGDAGIRAGNLNIAAQVILNAENIQVSGASTGVPVTDTSGLSAGLAGNSALGDTQSVQEATRSVASNSGDARKAAEETRQNLAGFRPSFITVEVLGFGTGSIGDAPAGAMDEAEKQRRELERRRRGG